MCTYETYILILAHFLSDSIVTTYWNRSNSRTSRVVISSSFFCTFRIFFLTWSCGVMHALAFSMAAIGFFGPVGICPLAIAIGVIPTGNLKANFWKSNLKRAKPYLGGLFQYQLYYELNVIVSQSFFIEFQQIIHTTNYYCHKSFSLSNLAKNPTLPLCRFSCLTASWQVFRLLFLRNIPKSPWELWDL